MFKVHNPSSVHAPSSTYVHGIEIPPNARLLYIAGQTGVGPDGKLRDGITAQSEQVWQNIQAILADAGMGMENLVKITTFLTDATNANAFRAVRAKALGTARPTATFLIVQGLADPGYLVEVEAVAAKI